jgi:hypothetical protein
MTRTDPFIDQLEGYLDEYEGFTPLPDAVRDSVRAKLPRTKQIGSLRGLMKYVSMTMSIPAPARYGLMAAVVLAAAALGSVFFSRGGNVGADATPTPTPSPTLIEPGGPGSSLAAGTYYVDTPFPVHVTFDLPQGWDAWAYTPAGSQINLSQMGSSGEVSFEIVDNISANPCTERLLDPPVGPSVEELVTALSNMPRFDASPATDITIDGFHGKRFTLTAPVGDLCGSMLTWKTTTRQNGVGPGEVNDVRIIDVDGTRLLICIAYTPPLTEEEISELDSVVDSVQIRP